MAKIKKLKENGATIYPATIPEGVVDTNGFTLAELLDELLEVLAGGSRGNMELAFSDLRAAIGSTDGYDLSRFVAKVNVFLEDADASDTTINRWKEIESFLAGITDTETLTGLLAENLQSAKGYADTKVQQGTANAVTMSSNAGAADRVLTSAGTNRAAKDSGVLLSDLARNTTATSSANGLMSKEDKTKLDTLNTDFHDLTPEVVTMNDYEDEDSPTMGIIIHDRSGGSTKKVKNSGVLLNDFLRKDQFPVATASALGGVKSGGNITVASDGSVTVNNAGVAQMAQQDSSGRVIVNTYVPKTQIATSSAAGLVKSGNDITVASDGTVTVNSATTVDNIPAATSSKIGGIKSGGDVLVSSSGVVTVNNAASAEEAVHATTADNATNVTNVPVATSSKIGGIKSAGDISVDSSGSVTVNNSAFAMQANLANSALRDGAGAQINTTYLKAAAVTDVTDYAEITI